MNYNIVYCKCARLCSVYLRTCKEYYVLIKRLSCSTQFSLNVSDSYPHFTVFRTIAHTASPTNSSPVYSSVIFQSCIFR